MQVYLNGQIYDAVMLADPSGNVLGNGAHPLIVNISGSVTASDGVALPLESLAQALTSNGPNGSIDTVTVSYSGNNYKQTLTYTNGLLTGISAWVKQ